MRKLLVSLALTTVIFTSCKKTEISPGLIGKWELRHASGGWGHDSTYVAGNGNIYQFNPDSTYKLYDNGALTSSGRFHIRKGNNFQVPSLNTIYFDNSAYGDVIEINATKLTIGTTIADGVAYEYVKIK
ncbi:hypothetical protein [Mucilaginibacter ginsenosidivorans]|uniref:Lipocalin-like domain-containing protein n=1 Tax=Mucilaginibacter ginsenosidivorans TaxID=398053 RepID=A0A5B8UU85_9SPHI|nr:hypothetical protein [Mucilaginibacter ginsenosidivorans]QEC62680.1 hypothetical protein FRZ54_08800 [Mucilaginibacter ginsenosidivorans]